MDTPERSKVGGTPLSKFEDSPIFNFINSLSPIQPVKSVHGAQAFHSLSFASISSVFSSPHVNSQKESRFLIRHPFSDSSKLEISSDNVDESNLCPGISNAIKLSCCSAVARENCNITCSLNEATVDLPDECSTQPSTLPQPIQYDCGSPNHNTTPCYGIKADLKLGIGHTTVEVGQFVQDGVEKRKILFTTEIELWEKHQVGQSKEEVAGYDWENLISDDADDLLIFDSSTESEACKGQDEKLGDNDANSLAPSSSKLENVSDILRKTQPEVRFGPCLQNATQDPPIDNNVEVGEQHGTDHTPQLLSVTCQNQVTMSDQTQKTGNEIGCKVESQQQRGMRRRCLVFEVAGVSKKNSNNSSNLPSSGKFTSDDRQLISLRPGSSSSPYPLPGIGLHLNTLATTSKDRVVTQETFPCGRRLISMPCSISPFPPITDGQKSPKSLDLEKDQCPIGSEVWDLVVTHDDASEAPALGVGDDLSQSSPKKKKRKSENGGESEACKRCNCKKSKCLKLYCECFAAGVYCVEPCSCQGCFNKPIHEETVLATRKQIESRNPLAFAPKVIRASEPVPDMGEETNKTPASARHKRGCNCKKSSCLKKYCECYQGGVGCSVSCRCEGCKNAFGRKDAAEEIEHGEEDMDGREKQRDKPDEGQQNAVTQKDEHHLSESILPITPLQICRPSVKLPFLSSGKPPRFSTLSIGYPTSHTLRKCDIPLPQRKVEKHFKTVLEDDTPEILRGDASPSNGVKTASPNRKRVSPPHNGIGISPSRKGGRKLILKSIPSFPSLNSDASNEYPVNYSSSPFSSSALS